MAVKLFASGGAEPGLRQLRVTTPGGLSNVGRFAVGELPEVAETDPNDLSAATELRQLPVVVHGVVGRNEDRDRFRFTAVAGQQFVFDLCAPGVHPCGTWEESSWFHGVLILRDAAGRQLAQAAYRQSGLIRRCCTSSRRTGCT